MRYVKSTLRVVLLAKRVLIVVALVALGWYTATRVTTMLQPRADERRLEQLGAKQVRETPPREKPVADVPLPAAGGRPHGPLGLAPAAPPAAAAVLTPSKHVPTTAAVTKAPAKKKPALRRVSARKPPPSKPPPPKKKGIWRKLFGVFR